LFVCLFVCLFVLRPHTQTTRPCTLTLTSAQEAVELPLTHPEYYEEMGIRAPKGVILYGPPGTGKTLLAKAVANQTSATFLRVVGSELIQKYSGEGPKLVRELFRVAEENAPSIVFIDEIDAIGTKRCVCVCVSVSVCLCLCLCVCLCAGCGANLLC
jgi:replication-associated recombination protein RarA